ncbi:PREDICTED: docking protein 2 [Ficedula albicollis]|uniref:docking protein 2 n=1 Tax=Ficedula albicollis TaxID=59894 RepID=UPI0007AD7EFE|nr:PREDICTED: docking protein 2 [Ficedula albicollis]
MNGSSVTSVTTDTSVTSATSVTSVTSVTTDTSTASAPSATSVTAVTTDTIVTSAPSATSVTSVTTDTSVPSAPSAPSVPSVTGVTGVTTDSGTHVSSVHSVHPSQPGLGVTPSPSVVSDVSNVLSVPSVPPAGLEQAALIEGGHSGPSAVSNVPPVPPACPEQSFEVTVRATPPSQRCRLRGRCILRAAEESLELLCRWPYRFLRRFGRDKVTFSFEAGRRCSSGEGNFEFDTRQGNEIFAAIEAAIELQRGRGGPADGAPRPLDHGRTPSWAPEEPKGPSGEAKAPRAEGKGVKGKAGVPPGAGEPPRGADFPYAEPLDSLRRGNAPDKGWRAECEYAVPFDTIAKSFLARQLGCPQEEAPSVTGDAGGARPPPARPTAPKPEHIYDEPEGLSALSALSVYDEPEEVKGEAWRLQAAPEEPPGHACPYNPQRDDYAVPTRRVPLRQPFLLHGREWLGDSDYDNVALKVARNRNLQ